MTRFVRDDALLLAATEITPAEWRDLGDVMVEGASFADVLGHTVEPARNSLVSYLRENLDYARVDHWEKVLFRLGLQSEDMRLVRVTDSAYPANLRGVRDRPPFLFIDGTLTPEDARSIAIVGQRKASPEGAKAASAIARALAEQGVTVVSGLALGIDSAAHEGALSAKGRTIAVLGTGIDLISPKENTELADRIRKRGCLVSQFRPGSPPTRSSFPMRNAIISGMTRASLLIEGEERSGTRIEAEHALRQGRPVLIWKPTMESIPWARHFTSVHGVRMVETISELLDAVDAAPVRH